MSGTPPAGQGSGSPGSIPRGLVNRRGSVIKPSERLPSLRTRDLTLGGIPKKSFKPNIPVRREKKEDGKERAESSTSSPSTSRRSGESGRGGRGRGAGRGRGRGRGKAELIQSHSSIFEAGPTERLNARAPSSVFERPSFGGGGGGGGRGEGGRGGGGKGGMSKDFGGSGDFLGADERIKNLLRDDFVSDLGDSSEDGRYQPISLPMAKPPKPVKKKPFKPARKPVVEDDSDDEDEVEAKMETDELPYSDVKVKSEPMDVDDIEEVKPDMDEKKPDIKQSMVPITTHDALSDDFSTGRVTCTSLFTKSRMPEGEPMFFQLPDALPGLPIAEGEGEDAKPVVSGGKTEKPQESEKRRPCTLRDLPEGFLGKLQVLKSGKTRLVLTNGVTLDVTTGTPCGFLQDLVSVHIREGSEESSEMLTLGHIKHRIICTPDFQSLLNMPP